MWLDPKVAVGAIITYKSGIVIDFGATKISASKILKGRFLNTKKYPSKLKILDKDIILRI